MKIKFINHSLKIFFIYLLIFILELEFSTKASTSTIQTYNQPPGTTESSIFSVNINGQKSFVEDRGDNNIHFTNFSFSGEIVIEIILNEPFNTYIISPISYGIVPIINGNSMIIMINQPRKLLLRNINTLNDMLAIFANPLEENPPQIGNSGITDIINCGYAIDNTGILDETADIQSCIDSISSKGGGTIYFSSGSYNVGTLNIKTNVHLYFHGTSRLVWRGGTYKYLNINAVTGTRISGYGIITGHMLLINESDNVTIDGIIVAPSPPITNWWAIEIRQSDYFVAYNVKILNDFLIMSDGFAPHYASNFLVDDCFIFSGDDGVAIHAKDEINKPDINNVTIRNSIIFAGSSGCKIGTETYNSLINNVTFENIDLISFSHSGLNINPGDGAKITNVFFKNIRIEQWLDRGLSNSYLIRLEPWTRVWIPGAQISDLENIQFLNISSLVSKNSNIRGNFAAPNGINNLLFDKFYIQGTLVTNAINGQMSIDNYVYNMVFSNNYDSPAAPSNLNIQLIN